MQAGRMEHVSAIEVDEIAVAVREQRDGVSVLCRLRVGRRDAIHPIAADGTNVWPELLCRESLLAVILPSETRAHKCTPMAEAIVSAQ